MLKLHEYQRRCVEAIIQKPSVMLALDMGLGKTLITLTAIHELIYQRFSVSKVLIIAPKKVAEATWQAEIAKWDELSDLRVSTVLGTEKQRLAALETEADIYVTSRDLVCWLVDTCESWDFDMVVLDEASSFKNHASKRFKAMRRIRPKIRKLVELTGTPVPNGMLDLWAQIYLLDAGYRLGKYVTRYRDTYFTPDRRSRDMIYSYKLLPGAEERIYELIEDIVISMKASDYLTLPSIVYENIPVKLDVKAMQEYRKLAREAVLELENGVVTAANAAALSNKLLQLGNGAVYGENGETVEIHDAKLEALEELRERLGADEHLLVFYAYKHDLARIQKRFPDAVAYRGADDLRAWNEGKISMLLAHPASCAMGINLQFGGRYICWFCPTWNLEQYLQANARLYRQGQTKPVVVFHLIAEGTLDARVLRALESKDGVQEKMLSALKAEVRAIDQEQKV